MPQNQIPFEEDKFYHVYNHVIGDINLFVQEKDFLFFLNKYLYYLGKFTTTYAYCLMPNHFHFLLKVNSTCEKKYLPKPTYKVNSVPDKKQPRRLITNNIRNPISQAFSNLQNSYARRYNIKYDRKGGLFQSRIQRKHVDSPEYLLDAINYIHQNPVSHGFSKYCEEWKYSSYDAIIGKGKTKIDRVAVIEWFDDIDNFEAYHKEKSIEKYGLRMEMEY